MYYLLINKYRSKLISFIGSFVESLRLFEKLNLENSRNKNQFCRVRHKGYIQFKIKIGYLIFLSIIIDIMIVSTRVIFVKI